MGDRISIQFKNNGELSVVLFSHWGGMSFLEAAIKHCENIKIESNKGISTPLDRLEPQTVMVDFIRSETCDLVRVDGNLYLGNSETDGDNSDNGHHIIDLNSL